MSRLPPLNAIRAFEVAARHGSFVRAAADLGVTHWAVGKQIRLLEDWLGVPLFERRAQGVALTLEGTELLEDVGDLFLRLARAAERLRRPDVAGRVSGTVRVNMHSSFALRWLLPRLGTFQAQYPNVEVRISTTSRKLRYIASAFDVGIRSGPEQGDGLHCETLVPDIRRPACSPEILRKRPLESVHDLRRHTLLHSSTTRSAWSQWLSAAGAPGLTAFRHFELEHVYLQLQAAVDGLGVALAPMPLIEGDIAAGRLVCPIAAPGWHADDYTLVVRKDRANNAPVRAFRNWITSEARVSTDA
jgi:LysR family transcriptional regulator, glycine cleavage system transcriptional activator